MKKLSQNSNSTEFSVAFTEPHNLQPAAPPRVNLVMDEIKSKEFDWKSDVMSELTFNECDNSDTMILSLSDVSTKLDLFHKF